MVEETFDHKMRYAAKKRQRFSIKSFFRQPLPECKTYAIMSVIDIKKGGAV